MGADAGSDDGTSGLARRDWLGTSLLSKTSKCMIVAHIEPPPDGEGAGLCYGEMRKRFAIGVNNMWLITPTGFFSIVCKSGDMEAGTLTIRARVKSDLQALRHEALPSLGAITENEGTDYPYRAK